MTINRTDFGPFSTFGIELVALLLLTLAAGLAMSNYFSAVRDAMRRSDMRTGRRAQRRRPAA